MDEDTSILNSYDNLLSTPFIKSSTGKRVFLPFRCRTLANPTGHLKPGAIVNLLLGECVVASASLAVPYDGHSHYMRSLHGNHLSSMEKSGEYLIVVKFISAISDASNKPFPYSCPGPEGPPDTIENAFKDALYAWDAAHRNLN